MPTIPFSEKLVLECQYGVEPARIKMVRGEFEVLSMPNYRCRGFSDRDLDVDEQRSMSELVDKAISEFWQRKGTGRHMELFEAGSST